MATYPLMLLKSDSNSSFDKSILQSVKDLNFELFFQKYPDNGLHNVRRAGLNVNYLSWAFCRKIGPGKILTEKISP